jgi:hypothetical protein
LDEAHIELVVSWQVVEEEFLEEFEAGVFVNIGDC